MSLLKKNNVLKNYKNLNKQEKSEKEGEATLETSENKDISNMFKSKSRERTPVKPLTTEVDPAAAENKPSSRKVSNVTEDEFPQLDDMGDNISYTSISASTISKVDQSKIETVLSQRPVQEPSEDVAPVKSNISVSSSSSESATGSQRTKEPGAVKGGPPRMFEDDECSEHIATPRITEESPPQVDLNSYKNMGSLGSNDSKDMETQLSELSISKHSKLKKESNAYNEAEKQDTNLTDEWEAANAAHLENVANQETFGAQIRPISFWEAVIMLRKNKSAWPKVTTSAGTEEKLVPKKHKKSLFSCCEGSGKVAQKDPATENGVASQPAVVKDEAFLEALKKMPLDMSDLTHSRIIYSVYHGIASVSGGSYKAPSTSTILPWWQRQFKRSRLPSVVVTEPSLAEAKDDHDSGEGSLSTAVNWETVGFQGSNPATDLRGSGMLGLLTLLFMIDYYPLLAQKIWTLCHPPLNDTDTKSKRELKEIPFVLIGFNVTGIVLDTHQKALVLKGVDQLLVKSPNLKSLVDVEALKCEEKLKSSKQLMASPTPNYCAPTTSEINLRKQSPLLFTLCECFVGCMEMFWEDWLRKAKTMAPSVPTVADFNGVIRVVKQRVSMDSTNLKVYAAAAKARFDVLLEDYAKSVEVQQ